MSRKLSFAAFLFSTLCIIAWAPSARAQSLDASDSLATVYDASKETKIQGSITKINAVNTGFAGTHVKLESSEGAVDVHLGAGPAADPARLGLSVGQSVEITGMMATVGGRNVFLARTLVEGDRTITLRNEHGIPVRAVMPQKTSATATAPKGGL